MRVVLDPNLDQVPAGLWLYRVDRKRGLLGGATTEGGNLYAWLQENLRLPPADELDGQLSAMPPLRPDAPFPTRFASSTTTPRSG